MSANCTLFACGSMGGGLALLVLAVLAIWVVSGVLFLANLCLVFELRDRYLLRHGSALLLYSVCGLAAYNQVKFSADNGFFLLAGAIGLPAIVIGHFIWLVRRVRRESRARRGKPHPS